MRNFSFVKYMIPPDAFPSTWGRNHLCIASILLDQPILEGHVARPCSAASLTWTMARMGALERAGLPGVDSEHT